MFHLQNSCREQFFNNNDDSQVIHHFQQTCDEIMAANIHKAHAGCT